MAEVLDQLEAHDQNEDQGEESVSQYETRDGKPYADDLSNLNEDRIADLRSICNAMDERDEWARMIEIIRATLRRYFWLGQQHPYWNAEAGMFQVGPSGVTLGEEDENAEEFFEEEFNIYKAYGEVFISVFSQTAAPARMEPDKPTNGDSVKAAREAQKYLDVYEKYNPAKCAQSEVGRLMWTDGRIVAVTEYETDEEKCGVDEDGNPLGAEITKYYGVLESKVPIIEDFRQWPYCRVDREIDVLTAKDQNPKIAQKIDSSSKGQTPNNEIARMSRIAVAEGIAQVSSDTLAYLVTESTYWLRPSAFRHLDQDRQAFWIGGKQNSEDGSKEQTEGLCPKGLRVKWVGSVFAKAKPIAMEQQVKVMHTNPGTGNTRGSKSDALVPVQMEFNDGMNMYSEMIHKCIPHKIVNTDAASLAAITEQFSRYGEWSAMQIENGRSLAENIFEEDQIDVPASFEVWLQNLQATLSQQLANIQPAMFGGNMEDQKTAKAYQQAKDMSLGVMAIVWVPYLEFASGIRWQAARLAAEREEQNISVVLEQKDGKTKTVSLDTSVLKQGGFLCKPVNDLNFPESHTDKANKWVSLFAAVPQNPVAQLIFQEPDNLVALKDAIGLDELVLKGAAARDKQLAEWELMQREDGPIPDIEATEQKEQAKQQAAQQVVNTVNPGAQAPPVPQEPLEERSSVPTRLADDHIEEARTCVRILNDAKTLDMLASRPEVVHDLELHLIEHLKKAQAAGIVIPGDLLGILPLPAPPVPGSMPPGAAGAGPTLPGAPGAAGAAPKPAAAGGAGAPPLIPPPTNVSGGPSALATT
jgi:hypothetical protein